MKRLLPLFPLLLLGCPRTYDLHLVANAKASVRYYQCRYELLCVPDIKKWDCKDSHGAVILPPTVRPTPGPGECRSLYAAFNQLRWETQTAEAARGDVGKLPPISRQRLKEAKKALEKP